MTRDEIIKLASQAIDDTRSEVDLPAQMLDLITTTFEALSVPGMTAGDAARELANGLKSDIGMTYDATRIGQWRRGERAIPQPVQDWMLRACIAHAIGQCGGTAPPDDASLDRLAAMLCPPVRGS